MREDRSTHELSSSPYRRSDFIRGSSNVVACAKVSPPLPPPPRWSSGDTTTRVGAGLRTNPRKAFRFSVEKGIDASRRNRSMGMPGSRSSHTALTPLLDGLAQQAKSALAKARTWVHSNVAPTVSLQCPLPLTCMRFQGCLPRIRVVQHAFARAYSCSCSWLPLWPWRPVSWYPSEGTASRSPCPPPPRARHRFHSRRSEVCHQCKCPRRRSALQLRTRSGRRRP